VIEVFNEGKIIFEIVPRTVMPDIFVFMLYGLKADCPMDILEITKQIENSCFGCAKICVHSDRAIRIFFF